MTKLGSGVLLACLLVGCGSDGPPGANLGLDKTLVASPLTELDNLSMLRAGDDFILAGYDNGTVRWARLGRDGSLSGEASFPLAQPTVGPVFAVTTKTSPADQLIALSVVPSHTVAEGYDLTATVHSAGEAAPAAPVILNAGNAFPAGTDPTLIQLAAGAATSGSVGYVAWGTRVKGKPIYYSTLPADAAVTANPSTLLGDPAQANAPAWDCLAAQERQTGWSFGAVTANDDPNYPASNFNTVEVDEQGATTIMTYQLTVTVSQCQIVGAPTPSGNYFMAFRGTASGSPAIDFAAYYPPPPGTTNQSGTVSTQHPVMPAATFGDPLSMPRPVWVASAGPDVVIGLSRRSGNQVVRYRYDAVEHGSPLSLRCANGSSGPMVGRVTDDGVWVTYVDQVKSGSGTARQRYFMRIDSPASLP
jgi:hypothetical protein